MTRGKEGRRLVREGKDDEIVQSLFTRDLNIQQK
jgi:hypothetical protein